MGNTVLVTDGVAKAGLAPLLDGGPFTVAEVEDSSSSQFSAEIASADALIVRSATQVTAGLFERASRLRVVGRAGVGVDNVDLEAASSRGIPVFNAPGGNTIAAAELTVGLMLAVARKITAANDSVLAGEWDRPLFKGIELDGKTLGLIGAGRIGAEVAKRCKAFGMDVVIYDPYLPPERAREIGAELTDLEVVLDRGDFISIHVPLNDETRGICGWAAMERMKSSAIVINASRGGVVDEVALVGALERGSIAGAALDVFDKEPLPDSSPLRDAPNIVLTPHIGASTAEAQIRVAFEVAEKVGNYLLTGDLTGSVNASSLA